MMRSDLSWSDGSFTLVPSAQTGLAAKGEAVACAVGDFDGDALPDVAVAMSDRVLLFKNHGGGKFTDVTLPPACNLQIIRRISSSSIMTTMAIWISL